MAVKEFKAESKRLLELMIHSIYTNREIFLRELISNASDAIDKLYFKSLTDNSVGVSQSDFGIKLAVEKDARTITLTDNGIGMSLEELENNLGTIAKSGSLSFKEENKDNQQANDINIIGQFGVGFYSAFMVAKEVCVTTKQHGSDKAYQWKSSGVDGYEIAESSKDQAGSEIVLYIKDNTEQDNYDEFLSDRTISGLVKKYSDYVRYPISMAMSHSRKKEDSDEYEDYIEVETLNTMVPLWRKNKSDITTEEYNEFYKGKFDPYQEPISVIHSKTEGTATYHAMMFVPATAPYNYYNKEYEKGLQLYSNGVLIMDKCADLLPDYFSFVRGLVDSADLSLNISREMLQQDRQLKIIAKSLDKKIKTELVKLSKNDREQYDKFWENFGRQIKFGVYEGFGANKEHLQDLLMFHSSTENKMVTFSEYIERMKDGQDCIYYASGESVARIENLPQVENVKDHGFEILYMTQDVDEFCIKMIMEYNEKKFVAVKDASFDDQEEENKISDEMITENVPLLTAVQTALDGKVKNVRLTNKLRSHPVCISNEGDVSIEMEKILASMPNANGLKTERILELNPNHQVFEKLKKYQDSDMDKLNALSSVLYTQALLLEGVQPEDPSQYVADIYKLLD